MKPRYTVQDRGTGLTRRIRERYRVIDAADSARPVVVDEYASRRAAMSHAAALNAQPPAVVAPEAITAFLQPVPPRAPISLRVDRRVLDVLRAEADRRGVGYQTLIHDVLTSAAIQFGGQS